MSIPAGWKVKKLGDLLNIQNGFAFDSELFSKDAGTPLIRIRDLKNGCSTEIRFNGSFDESYIVRAGDLLIGMDGEFRCYQWEGDNALLNQRVCRFVEFSDQIDPAFVRWAVNSHLKEIEDRTPYVTVKHLSAKSIKAIGFAYPTVHEQRRIVGRIKECMERVNEIEQLRNTSLSEAEAILPSVLNEVFKAQAGLAPIMTIGDFATETRYGTSKKCAPHVEGTPIIRIPNVVEGTVNFEDLKYCVLPTDELTRIRLEDGDLLFVRTNGSRDLVGRCAIFYSPEAGSTYGFASYLIRVRVDKNRVLPQYLAYFLNSTNGRAEINQRRRTSAGQFNINSENLRTIPLPVPTLSEQARLIELLREREERARALVSNLRSLSHEGAIIRESILRKAFAGEL